MDGGLWTLCRDESDVFMEGLGFHKMGIGWNILKMDGIYIILCMTIICKLKGLG
jgi:hypothetical protein